MVLATVKYVSELHAVSSQIAFLGIDDFPCYLIEFWAKTEMAFNPLLLQFVFEALLAQMKWISISAL